MPAIHLGSLRIDSRSDVKSSGSAATNQTFKRSDTLRNESCRLSYFPHCIFRETIIATSSAATGRPCILMRGKATTSLARFESSNFILMCQLSCVEQGLSLVVLSAAKDPTPVTRPGSDRSVRSFATLRMTEMSVAAILHVSSV